jgi:hypothetical protein
VITGIRMVVLSCPACSSSLSGWSDSTFFYCANCGGGFELNAGQQLDPVKVYFARYRNGNSTFLPFWAFDATLQVQEREAKRGLGALLTSNTGLIKLFHKNGALRFYIPASGEPDDHDARGLQLTLEQPEPEFFQRMQEIPPVRLSTADARKVADYMFLTSEISQRDTLRSLRYELTLTNPILIVIGF